MPVDFNEDDLPSSEQFLAICYKCKLTNADLDEMTYSDCIDYIEAYSEMHNPDRDTSRKATQSDIDNFFG